MLGWLHNLTVMANVLLIEHECYIVPRTLIMQTDDINNWRSIYISSKSKLRVKSRAESIDLNIFQGGGATFVMYRWIDQISNCD